MPYRKILFLSANPKDTRHLRLDEEIREVEIELHRARYRELFKLEQRWALQPRDLQKVLLEIEPEIVHFSGHGSNKGEIFLEGVTGTSKLIEPLALAELFSLCNAFVKCVVLNACYSESQARAIHGSIQTVIGMRGEISNSEAIQFSVGFYTALGAGREFEEAFKFGRNAINLDKISGDQNQIPILLQGGIEGSSALSMYWNNEAYVSLHLVQELLEKANVNRKSSGYYWYPQQTLKKKLENEANRKYIADFVIQDNIRNIQYLIEVKSANNKINDSARFQVKNYLRYSGIKYGVIIDPFRIEVYKYTLDNRLLLIEEIEIEALNNLGASAMAFKHVLDNISNENSSNSHI